MVNCKKKNRPILALILGFFFCLLKVCAFYQKQENEVLFPRTTISEIYTEAAGDFLSLNPRNFYLQMFLFKQF